MGDCTALQLCLGSGEQILSVGRPAEMGESGPFPSFTYRKTQGTQLSR